MKTIWMVCMLMPASWIGVQAQTKGRNCTERNQVFMRYLKDSVRIDANQEVRIGAIQDSTCMLIQTTLKQYAGNREAANPEIERIRKESMLKVRALLTDEQRAYIREKRKQRNKNSGIPPGL
jgi:hypothetical protein